jgi:pimeloyl-ACP methyl ester carboxylesterase
VRALLLVLALVLLPGCVLRWQTDPLPRPAGATTARIGEAVVHYRVSGPEDAPAVVLIHGFASNRDIWAAIEPRLAESHRVLSLDLLGFGHTSRFAGDYSRQAQQAMVLALMDEVGIDRASVVAHSMGSAVSLGLAADAPDRVEQLVLLGAWVFEEQVPWSFRDARQPGIGEGIFGVWFEEHLDLRMRYGFYDPDSFVTEAVLEHAREGLKRPGARAAALATIRGVDLVGLEEQLPAIDVPVRLIHGANDPVARIAFAERLANRLPDVELFAIAECGHFPMLEAPGRTATLVGGALR